MGDSGSKRMKQNNDPIVLTMQIDQMDRMQK